MILNLLNMRALKPLVLVSILCVAAVSCAKKVPVDNSQIEELKRRQTELEASQARVLRELDRIRGELMVLEEAVNALQAGERTPAPATRPQPLEIAPKEGAKAGKPEALSSLGKSIGAKKGSLVEAERLIGLGRAAEAIFVLLDIEPETSSDEERCQTKYLMARAYRELTEWRQALKWAEGVDNNTCKDLVPKARLIRIESLIKLGQLSEAKRLFNSLVTEYPDSPEAKEAESLF